MTVRELSERITFREFEDWLLYLDWADYRHQTREDYYLAQIALEVRRSYVKHPNQVKFKDFVYRPPDIKEKEDRVAASKAAWLSVLEMKPPAGKKRKS